MSAPYSYQQPDYTLKVYFENGNTTPLLLGRISANKAKEMSLTIRNKERYGVGFRGDRQAMAFTTPDVDAESARIILSWIDKYDFNSPGGPQGLTQAHVGEDFIEILQLYATAHAMGVPVTLRGNALRDDILGYVRMAPVDLNEFIAVRECTTHDPYIFTVTMNNMVNLNAKYDPKKRPPMMREVEEYCRATGLGEKLAEMKEARSASRQASRGQDV